MSWRALRPVAIFLAEYIIISEGFTWAYNDGGLVAPLLVGGDGHFPFLDTTMESEIWFKFGIFFSFRSYQPRRVRLMPSQPGDRRIGWCLAIISSDEGRYLRSHN